MTQYPCPSCRTVYQLPPDLPVDHPIRCATCGTVFVRSAPPVAPAAPVDDFASWHDSLPAPAPSAPRPRPAATPSNRMPLILAGSGAALVLVVVLGLGLAYALGGGAKPKAVAKKPTETKSTDDFPKRLAAKPKPPAPKPEPPKPMLPDSPAGWLQDFEKAQVQAKAEKKDILILFNGSDWCPWCMRLTQEVFADTEFRERSGLLFVPVHLDFPRGSAKARVENPGRNDALAARFQVEAYPTVMLTDAAGRPYALTGYVDGGAAGYVPMLSELADRRIKRDELFAAIESASGVAKLAAAKEAVAFLEEHDVENYYTKELRGWSQLADQLDRGNKAGRAEELFAPSWVADLRAADSDKPETIQAVAARLSAWAKANTFRNQDMAAGLHLMAARALSEAGLQDDAVATLQAGRNYKPKDPRLSRILGADTMALGMSSGTGFLVSAEGHLLTNAHVVSGTGPVMVRIGTETVPAKVLARDRQRDIALVKLERLDGLSPPTLARPVALRKLERGEKVAALGYPLGDAVGSGLKLTTGVVSGTPETATNQMLVLDAKVNPGNSGGPLCDGFGNVVGMVTAKSRSGENIESYGMALPASDLEAFLQRHLPSYEVAMAREQPLEWNAVDKMVSPSVLMVLQGPGKGKSEE